MSDASLLPDAAAGAGLLLAAVYGVSGVAKVGDVQSTASAFRELRLPRWTVAAHGPRLLGPAEIALAGCLLLLPSPWYWLPATASLLLGVLYTLLIVRALGFDVPVTCGCFGRLGQGAVTRATVVRNLVLSALGAVTVADAATGGSVVGRLLSGPDLWWWALVLGAAVLVAWLVGGGAPGQGAAAAPAAAHPGSGAQDELLDYIRQPIPFVRITGDDGPLHLREMAQEKAWLVLWVSLGCTSCTTAMARAEQFARDVPHLGVLVVTTAPSAVDDPMRPQGVTMAFDHEGQLRTMLDLRTTPSAVLLGRDGQLAGGPVAGTEVPAFIDAVEAELREAQQAADAPEEGAPGQPSSGHRR